MSTRRKKPHVPVGDLKVRAATADLVAVIRERPPLVRAETAALFAGFARTEGDENDPAVAFVRDIYVALGVLCGALANEGSTR